MNNDQAKPLPIGRVTFDSNDSRAPYRPYPKGGPLPNVRISIERDPVERIWANHGIVFDHALTPDEVQSEYVKRCSTPGTWQSTPNQFAPIPYIDQPKRITVNKSTHRIRFENETESSVDVIIERKE